MNKIVTLFVLLLYSAAAAAQDARLQSRVDAGRITVGDQARLFIEIQHDRMQSKLQWAVFPDTFNSLEIVDKGRIDTVIKGDIITYRQKLSITGFDSGLFTIPSFQFTVIPNRGSPYVLRTDSFSLLVQTVAVDTTQAIKPIKEIIPVQTTWMDYIWLIVGVAVFIMLAVVIILYFLKNRKTAIPEQMIPAPSETLQERYLRYLEALDREQLWQSGRVKEYYIALTDILRNYIEDRFRTPAMELTTDELLAKVRMSAELNPHQHLLEQILRTADLAKFAKAQPLPQEHTAALDHARQFISTTGPVITDNPPPSNDRGI